MQLKKGSKGKFVKELQVKLGLTVDGIFGSKTEKAVKEYQEKEGLLVDGIVGDVTWKQLHKIVYKYKLEQIYNVIKSKGYNWFNGDKYDINIVGIRNSETEGRVTNHYDDHITVSYKLEGNWHFHCWNATTDPGQYWMEHPSNTNGCAILVPGQYSKVYKIDKHNGKYEALCQRNGMVKVYRDGNLDAVYDHVTNSIDNGYFGINIHRSSAYKIGTYINKYSAGCQVFQDPDDFDEFMELCYKAKDIWGNKFTYTLIESKDIKK